MRAVATQRKQVSLVERIATRFHVAPEKILPTLRATAFKQPRGGDPPSDEQCMALLVVADQYNLNPFTREIFAFPDKQNGIVPVVSIDGWVRITNEHPAFNGVKFRYAPQLIEAEGGRVAFEWIECEMHRKDRQHPIVIREYLDEVYREPFRRDDGNVIRGPWQTHTKRMHRHKAYMQCARIAFGFAGIYDEEEASVMMARDITAEGQVVGDEPPPALSSGAGTPQPTSIDTARTSRTEALKHRLSARGKSAGERAEAKNTFDPPAQDIESEAGSPPSFAEVAHAINQAKDPDALDLAIDLIRGVKDAHHQKELGELAQGRMGELKRAQGELV